MKFLDAFKNQLKIACGYCIGAIIAGSLRWGFYPFFNQIVSQNMYIIIGGLIGLVVGSFIQMYDV